MNEYLQKNLQTAKNIAFSFAIVNGGKLHRHPGGFWSSEHLEEQWFGPQTVDALVNEGHMKFTQYKNIRGEQVAVVAEVVPQ